MLRLVVWILPLSKLFCQCFKCLNEKIIIERVLKGELSEQEKEEYTQEKAVPKELEAEGYTDWVNANMKR